MNKMILGLAAASAAFLAAPAMATLAIDESACVSVLVGDGGCKFTGANSYTDAELMSLYNATTKAGVEIDLDRLTKFEYDAQAFEDFGAFVAPAGSYVSGGGTSGTWGIPGYLIDFIGVKAGTELTLFKLADAVSTGVWNIAGKKGMSHIVFYGMADTTVDPQGVPEPASWAMLIAGFGLVGASMRRRSQRTLTVSA